MGPYPCWDPIRMHHPCGPRHWPPRPQELLARITNRSYRIGRSGFALRGRSSGESAASSRTSGSLRDKVRLGLLTADISRVHSLPLFPAVHWSRRATCGRVSLPSGDARGPAWARALCPGLRHSRRRHHGRSWDLGMMSPYSISVSSQSVRRCCDDNFASRQDGGFCQPAGK